MEYIIVSIIVGLASSALSIFVVKKLDKAKFQVFIEQAKAKAKVIEHEAEVALKDAQLKAKFECDKEQTEENNEVKVEKVEKKTEFQLKTTNNSIVNIKLENDKIIIAEYPGKIVLLNFFATWCPPCKAEIPNLIKLQEDYKNDLEVVSVLLEEMKTNEEILAFIKQYDINYTVTYGVEGYDLAKGLGGIKSIPTMYLINKESTIFQKYVGIVPNEMMEIDIKKVLEK